MSEQKRKYESKFAHGAVSRGRTKDVLQIAGELFLSRGYEGVSLEMIVTKTGGSFRELYREFGSKQKLFLRVLHRLCDEVIGPLDSTSDADDPENLEPIEQVLSSISRKVLEMLLSPRFLALHRLMLSESKRFPALGKKWVEAGPNSANRAVAAVLARYSKTVPLAAEDPCLLAAVFLDSLINNLQLRKLNGMAVSSADIEQRVRICVEVFLNGVRSPQHHFLLHQDGGDV